MANKKTSSQATLPKVARRKQQLLVVQFPHPGTEAVPTRLEKMSNPIVKAWNQGSHKRKFMKAKGQIVDCNGNLLPEQDLLFWGEWEPTSWVYPIQQSSGNGVQPQWLHIPFLDVSATPPAGVSSNVTGCGGAGCNPTPNVPTSLQQKYSNTDPLVFGDYFIYSNCRQTRKNDGVPAPTQMQSLLSGSIILFGSKLSDQNGNPYFALDTVFVVGESRPYVPKDCKIDLNGFVPHDFARIMGPSFMNGSTPFTCYRGATVNNPIEGMYSFLPCKPYPGMNIGFPRVKLTDKDFAQLTKLVNNSKIIINGLSQNYHYTEIQNLTISKKIWETVCDIVKQQGYERGVNLKYQRIP